MHLTFNNDDAFRRVRSQFIGGDASIFSRVSRLRVDHFYSNDAIRVCDWVLGRVQLFATLHPFDLLVTRRE